MILTFFAVVLTSPNHALSRISDRQDDDIACCSCYSLTVRGQWDLTAERCYTTTAVVLISTNHALGRISDRQDDDIACCSCNSLTCVGSGI